MTVQVSRSAIGIGSDLSIPGMDGTYGFGNPPQEMATQVLKLHDYWRSRTGERDIPDRRDLDPLADIPSLLSNVWLLDIESDPRRYRYRLLGSGLARPGPNSKTGTLLHEAEARRMEQVIAALDRCSAERTPFWRMGKPLMHHDKLVDEIHTIALPLTVDGSDDVRMLINISIYRWLEA